MAWENAEGPDINASSADSFGICKSLKPFGAWEQRFCTVTKLFDACEDTVNWT